MLPSLSRIYSNDEEEEEDGGEAMMVMILMIVINLSANGKVPMRR